MNMTGWLGSPGNRSRAHAHDKLDEPQGKTWECPRCGNPLDLVAEHAFSELWECAQCGYAKKVKQ